MANSNHYFIPAQSVEVSTEIKRSRFIARIAHCQNTDEAFAIINQVKKQFPDARHHCWAFIACPSNSATIIRYSDDGEPSGTAGKPILNVLNHSHYGEIICVVSRYFGGIKLGAGGLVRAYSNSTLAALEQLSVRKKVNLSSIKIQFSYPFESTIRHYIESIDVKIVEVIYSEQVIFHLALAEELIAPVLAQSKNLCKGDLVRLMLDE